MESVWIGQGAVIYTGEPQTMNVLRLFLRIHVEHALRFVDEHSKHEEDGWAEVTPDNYKERWKHYANSWFWDRD
jgi:hypothetical protein